MRWRGPERIAALMWRGAQAPYRLRSCNRTSTPAVQFRSLHLRVLRFGFFQDGDVGVGVFPEREEILICRSGFDSVAVQEVGAGQGRAR